MCTFAFLFGGLFVYLVYEPFKLFPLSRRLYLLPVCRSALTLSTGLFLSLELQFNTCSCSCPSNLIFLPHSFPPSLPYPLHSPYFTPFPSSYPSSLLSYSPRSPFPPSFTFLTSFPISSFFVVPINPFFLLLPLLLSSYHLSLCFLLNTSTISSSA